VAGRADGSLLPEIAPEASERAENGDLVEPVLEEVGERTLADPEAAAAPIRAEFAGPLAPPLEPVIPDPPPITAKTRAETATAAPMPAIAERDSALGRGAGAARRCAAAELIGETDKAMRDCPHSPHQ
jgi:hypothetical protein